MTTRSSVNHSSATKLDEASLSTYSEQVRVPKYDRSAVTHGIVHIGVGGFHRAHQALYMDNYIEQNPGCDWGICGVGLLKYDKKMSDALHSQDCLYTLVERSPESESPRVIGSMMQYLFAPDDPQKVIDTLADAQCRIVTLTITEGGYYVIEGTGEFDAENPVIQNDLKSPDQPVGVYGYLTAALKKRRDNGLPPFTVLSCDNIQGNGNVVGKMLTTFAKLQDAELGEWIEQTVSFPNCMVDRITPATTPADVERVRDRFGIEDDWPVVAEPFTQWVVEDRFTAGRPDWESVGVQMTEDVHPYELMKIRLLNTSHLLIGYLGELLGYTYVHEAMADEQIAQAARRLMDEVTPTLQTLPDVNFGEYKQTLIERFSNPKVQDQLPRLCLNSSAKLPKWALGSLRDLLKSEGSIDYLSFTIAAWFRYLEGTDDRGRQMIIDDPMAERLTSLAQSGGVDPTQLLGLKEIFGDLPNSSRFTAAVKRYLQQLHEEGAQKTLTQLLAK